MARSLVQGSVALEAQVPNLCAARNRAFAASSSRSLGGALVSSDCSSFVETAVISLTAVTKAAMLACEGLLNPLSFLTNCKAAARISSSVAGGAKLWSVLMLLHMAILQVWRAAHAGALPSRAAPA